MQIQILYFITLRSFAHVADNQYVIKGLMASINMLHCSDGTSKLIRNGCIRLGSLATT